ncbi:MAG: hypothetical protein DWI57_17225 [Chloroflexi bacterium]|nr:MAG: hypothetical protein DWI57_17225 [Chloroflexota bacterium]
MPTTGQMFDDYPDILLQVIAELRGAFLDAAENRREAIDLLALQASDPTSVLMAYQEVVDFHPQAQAALDALLSEGGELIEAQFSREYGSIRQMGPAKLEREQPWHTPESVAELLYYYGLLGRGFKGAGQNAHTIVYIPKDVIPWLPKPASATDGEGLAVIPVPPPPPARMLVDEGTFLEDLGSLLGFLHTDGLRMAERGGPHPDDVSLLVERLQASGGFVPSGGAQETGDGQRVEDVRLALLLHQANRLGLLRREGERVRLNGNRVYTFLEQNRHEQMFALWEGWRASPDWNDLLRTPGLDCAGGNWRNEPQRTREVVVGLLGRLQPGLWYSQSDLIAAIKEAAPDFQRPTGDYDSWYIRDSSTKEFLKGFEQWERVEGALLRFLFSGPLYWLHAFALAEPSAGDDLLVSLSPLGARWLGHDTPIPEEAARHPLVVGEDYTIRVPVGTPLTDRFRVERFAQWQSSDPQFVYQINQRSLQRAAGEGISAKRILDFLKQRARHIPGNVQAALLRLAESAPKEGQS